MYLVTKHNFFYKPSGHCLIKTQLTNSYRLVWSKPAGHTFQGQLNLLRIKV